MSEAPNRRISTAVTLVILVALLIVGAVLGFRSLFAPLPGDADAVEDEDITAPSDCTTETVDEGGRLTSAEVTVSVFNASTRSGLAGETLDALAARGFTSGEVGNAEAEVQVVQVWAEDRGDAAAKLVARQFGPETVIRETTDDLGPGVDVVVGSGYTGLAPAKSFIKVRNPQEVCVPEE